MSRPVRAVVVDARGQRCPLPIIAIARRARGLPPGTELDLLSTDPAARADVAAWCRMRGHLLLDQEAQDDALRSRVRLGPAGSERQVPANTGG